MEPLPDEIIKSQRDEILRLQKENLTALDQINKWSDEYVKLQKYNNSLENKVQQLLKERQDIGKMQQIMNSLNMQRNKNKKGIITPNRPNII